MDIFERVAAYRAESDQLAWNGTFKDYIELLRKNPSAAVTAHARVYDMIKSYGVEEVGGHKRYKFFEQEIFGLGQIHREARGGIFPFRGAPA